MNRIPIRRIVDRADRGDEPVSGFRDRLDQLIVSALLLKRLPQHINMLCEVRFFDETPLPKRIKQFLFLQYAAPVFDQVVKKLEALLRERDRLPVLQKAIINKVELKISEFVVLDVLL
jgi:hypothetical protein